MGARELTAVVVMGGEVYGPGYINPPPADVAEQITNPGAWGEEKPVTGSDSPQGGQTEEPATPSAPPATPAPTEPALTPAPEPPPAQDNEPPPRSGAGSGVEAWRAFATAKGVAYPAGAKREDIIAACENAKVI